MCRTTRRIYHEYTYEYTHTYIAINTYKSKSLYYLLKISFHVTSIYNSHYTSITNHNHYVGLAIFLLRPCATFALLFSLSMVLVSRPVIVIIHFSVLFHYRLVLLCYRTTFRAWLWSNLCAYASIPVFLRRHRHDKAFISPACSNRLGLFFQ